MKRIFKNLTIALLVLCSALVCAFAVACNGDNEEPAAADYTVTIVYPDGKPVNGQTDGQGGGKVRTQICLEDGSCSPFFTENLYPDENGKISFSQARVESGLGEGVTTFVFHALNVEGYGDCSVEITAKGNHTLTLKA